MACSTDYVPSTINSSSFYCGRTVTFTDTTGFSGSSCSIGDSHSTGGDTYIENEPEFIDEGVIEKVKEDRNKYKIKRRNKMSVSDMIWGVVAVVILMGLGFLLGWLIFESTDWHPDMDNYISQEFYDEKVEDYEYVRGLLWKANDKINVLENELAEANKPDYKMNVPEWNEFTKYHLQLDTTNLQNVIVDIQGDDYVFYIADGLWLSDTIEGTLSGEYEREEFNMLIDKYFKTEVY